MSATEPSSLDRAMAKVCEWCPVCLHARYHQEGVVYDFVKHVERDICPFCKAYERVHGKKAHEQRDSGYRIILIVRFTRLSHSPG